MRTKESEIISRKFQISGGYIAIVSALVLSAVVGAIVFVATTNIFFGRSNTAILKSKKNTRYLAESCLEDALLKFGSDHTYSGNETIVVGSSTCKTISVNASGTDRVFKVSATTTNSVTNLKLVAEEATLDKVSLEEVRAF